MIWKERSCRYLKVFVSFGNAGVQNGNKQERWRCYLSLPSASSLLLKTLRVFSFEVDLLVHSIKQCYFLVAYYATLHPALSVRPSVCPSVGRLVPILLFRRFRAFWAHCSYPNTTVTFSITAPAHAHATRVTVYPALFLCMAVAPRGTKSCTT